MPAAPSAQIDFAGLAERARELAERARAVTAAAPNERNLVHELEKELELRCELLGIPWTPYQMDRTLSGAPTPRFVDVAHGAIVIEYERPHAFAGKLGAALLHARAQAEEYAEMISAAEGRPLQEYVLVAWDGAHIDFGRTETDGPVWDGPVPFNAAAAERLLGHLRADGAPLVHPGLIAQLAGPEADLGTALVPLLFDAIRASPDGPTTKTQLLFTEWRRLFGQVAGVQSDRLREYLREQEAAHGRPYADHPSEYLFALYTYLALVAKLIAAMSLEAAARGLTNEKVAIKDRIATLESGVPFASAGIANMLNGDFFSWYADDASWDEFESHIGRIISRFSGVNFHVTRKTPESTRDLFKGLYQTFVPGALRHALGEFYTPDWLADHVLDVVGWQPGDDLLDPACGSGTFVLEALRRRLEHREFEHASAVEVLRGIHGLDLNPLAVLAARASLVVFLASRFDPTAPVRLPIFLADAVNEARADDTVFRHQLQTEKGVATFEVPAKLVRRADFYDLFDRLRTWVDADLDAEQILTALAGTMDQLDEHEAAAFRGSVEALVALHADEWDGIWCSILADRFAAGAIERASHVIGNPPWVKWSNLPAEYAAFIKDDCVALGVFSTDAWVGGIESDISTVVTFEALRSRLADGGTLAFLITGTVFANESSQGFRRFHVRGTDIRARVELVQDFQKVAPFEGVSNHTTLLVLKRDEKNTYPVKYETWSPPREGRNVKRTFASGEAFRTEATSEVLWATPVPGSDEGPWLKGTHAEHQVWEQIFGGGKSVFRARKGITTDMNGVYFVRVDPSASNGALVTIENDPMLGRGPNREIPTVKMAIEDDHLFPLLRGHGVSAFRAVPDPALRVLLPQREKDGDPGLPTSHPMTFKYLNQFKARLERRSSYRRYQAGKPWWSVWSTGPYTFSPFKVAWREMSGKTFAAAYVSDHADSVLGTRMVICDHKVYFVPCETEDEAAFLCGVLNAPVVSTAVGAYAAQLSLGASVVEYLDIPAYDANDPTHAAISALAKRATAGAVSLDTKLFEELDGLVATLLRL